MKFLKKLNWSPEKVLRVGLGMVFIYAGADIFFNPDTWLGFIPQWISGIMPIKTFLYLHAGFEIILGLLLLFGIFLSFFSLIAFLDLFAILIFYGVDSVTFRDFGLVMMALALFLLSTKKIDIKE